MHLFKQTEGDHANHLLDISRSLSWLKRFVQLLFFLKRGEMAPDFRFFSQAGGINHFCPESHFPLKGTKRISLSHGHADESMVRQQVVSALSPVSCL